MVWSKSAKPNKANIVRRIEAAQSAIDAAMDLCKAAGDTAPLKSLDNAFQWLVDANRKARK